MASARDVMLAHVTEHELVMDFVSFLATLHRFADIWVPMASIKSCVYDIHPSVCVCPSQTIVSSGVYYIISLEFYIFSLFFPSPSPPPAPWLSDAIAKY